MFEATFRQLAPLLIVMLALPIIGLDLWFILNFKPEYLVGLLVLNGVIIGIALLYYFYRPEKDVLPPFLRS